MPSTFLASSSLPASSLRYRPSSLRLSREARRRMKAGFAAVFSAGRAAPDNRASPSRATQGTERVRMESTPSSVKRSGSGPHKEYPVDSRKCQPDRLSIGKWAALAGGGNPHEQTNGNRGISDSAGGRDRQPSGTGPGGNGGHRGPQGPGHYLPRRQAGGDALSRRAGRGQALLLAGDRSQRRAPDARLAHGQGRAQHPGRSHPPEIRLVLPRRRHPPRDRAEAAHQRRRGSRLLVRERRPRPDCVRAGWQPAPREKPRLGGDGQRVAHR